MNNLNLIQDNIHLVENIKLFTEVNLQIFNRIINKLKLGERFSIDELEIDNQIIYRNPGQVVSFNNLYANILMSTGLIGLLWFLYIIIDILRKLVLHNSKLQPFILTSIISTLFMFSYQAEELPSHLAIAIAFSLNMSKNEE